MKLVEAAASIEVELERMDADSVVDQLTTIIGMTLNNPAIPMLARVAGMAALISGAAIALNINRGTESGKTCAHTARETLRFHAPAGAVEDFCNSTPKIGHANSSPGTTAREAKKENGRNNRNKLDGQHL